MYTNIKTLNEKELWLKALVNSECTHVGIDKQLVKKERIETVLLPRSFKIFNVDRTKNEKVTWFALLELEINEYTEKINIIVNYPSDTLHVVVTMIVIVMYDVT